MVTIKYIAAVECSFFSIKSSISTLYADMVVKAGRIKGPRGFDFARDVICGDQWMIELGSGDMRSLGLNPCRGLATLHDQDRRALEIDQRG